jgi:glycolate oxidase iron-sulfur subunit
MQTQLTPEYRARPDGLEAEAILRKCVHCGLCTATGPTYQPRNGSWMRPPVP